ncbi:PAAR domain-containing protein [Pseudomonas sp. PDM14]|uniref:PAAR domain-containing protein n=1 Tax=Pseudomonas sp. PDM14 TaxID=2769288 RepID=UPI00178728A1|nr:PAAR domain-containing protein [Pseudomonas sp. PDM14]MBD9483906.1 PAAR domain-containing protein [Pseudomonas sp. PDM14]
MPAVTRQGDACTGHGGFPPRASSSGSPNVLINGIPAHRQGDAWPSHCDPNSCHASTLAQGSGTVRVNGKPLGRVGDAVACGSTVAAGSPNVFAGG